MGLFAALIVYYEVAPQLWRASVWWDVAWLGFVVIPAVFGLVLLGLPLRRERWLLPVGLAFAVLAAVLTYADIDVFANFARLAACALLGWWFLGYFETISWVVLVASIIPWVDAYSVWRGPTKQIVEHHANVFGVSRSRSRSRASMRPRTSACRISSSSRSSSLPPRASACASTGRGSPSSPRSG